MSRDEFGPVKPTNLRTRRTRPDPDAPAAAPADTNPAPAPQPGPGPTNPTPEPSPATPSTAVAHAEGGTLADVLTGPNHRPGGVTESVAMLARLAAVAERPVDPMKDWVDDGTRMPRWLASAARHYARLYGRKVQEVIRDAMLGVEPIPEDVLDAAWLNHYGYPRQQYDPRRYQ